MVAAFVATRLSARRLAVSPSDGSVRESNPPRPFVTAPTGFEDRGQSVSLPSVLPFYLYGYISGCADCLATETYLFGKSCPSVIVSPVGACTLGPDIKPTVRP